MEDGGVTHLSPHALLHTLRQRCLVVVFSELGHHFQLTALWQNKKGQDLQRPVSDTALKAINLAVTHLLSFIGVAVRIDKPDDSIKGGIRAQRAAAGARFAASRALFFSVEK